MDDYVKKDDFKYFEDKLSETISILTNKNNEYEKRISLLEWMIDKDTLDGLRANIVEFNGMLAQHLKWHENKDSKFKLWIPLIWVSLSSLITGVLILILSKIF